MITINVIGTPSIHELTVTGHADFAKRGSDIVCAAVSAIVQTAALGIAQCASVIRDDGLLSIKMLDKCEKCDIILGTMMLGLRDIAAQYPNNVTIREEI